MNKKSAFLLGLLVCICFHLASAQHVAKSSKPDPYTADIQSLLKNKLVIDAYKIIDAMESSTVAELIELTEIPAPPFKESVRAQKVKQLFEAAGADKVWTDSVGNVFALRKGSNASQTIVLDAHLDTVFPEGTDVKVKHHGDTLYAPGISDDTRGLTAMLAVLRTLEKAKIETACDLLFMASVGEEGLGGLRGVKYFLAHNTPKIKSWISIDGTSIADIAIGALGSVRYKALIKGPGGHSWGAFGLGNPHHAMAKAINYFSDEAQRYTTAVGKTSFNVGRVGGGTSVNAIPFESWAEVDMRSESPEHLKKIDSIFKATMKKGLAEYNKNIQKGQPLTMTLASIGYRPSGATLPSQPLVQHAIAAAKQFDVTPELITESTNANIAIAKGIPAVTIGAGGKSDHAHALNEWWLNDHGAQGIKLALLLTLAETGLAK
ncbi:MAG: M20/M25/M40 family metallo-hydrolase [Bacteroidetes bacterium]|nr:M20/M25/M40 family metallo-hydrolase [Bacteroidota bacterium]